MDEFRITFQQLQYVWIASLLASVLFGTFPLVAGLKLGVRKYAYIGFIGSILLGALAVVLAFPFAAVMHWLIVRRAAQPSEVIVEDAPADTGSTFTSDENS